MREVSLVWECRECGAVNLEAAAIEASPDDHFAMTEAACASCGSPEVQRVAGFACAVCGRLVRAEGHAHARRG